MGIIDLSNTRPDYSYLGLTYAPAVAESPGDEGYTTAEGVLYSPEQASNMASTANRLLYPNITNSSMYVDYNKLQTDPANVVGALTRAQWEDYKLRFQPMEEQLMNMTSYNNPSVVSEEVAKAQAGAQQATQVSQGITGRNMARYGLSMNAAQQTTQDRGDRLSASTAAVDASNRARFGITDRNRAISVGSSPNAGRSYGLRSESLAG